jgi:hypothetical protein
MSARTQLDVHAMAYLNMAREYHEAANQLLSVCQRRPRIGSRRGLSDPINFLYFHTIELALKSFIRFHGHRIRHSHKLTELYEECRTLGLVIGSDDRFTIGNIVSLLESGNEYQGFRYFNLKSTFIPDSPWTREVVEALVRAIAAHAEVRAKDDNTRRLGPAVKGILIFDKPGSKGTTA